MKPSKNKAKKIVIKNCIECWMGEIITNKRKMEVVICMDKVKVCGEVKEMNLTEVFIPDFCPLEENN